MSDVMLKEMAATEIVRATTARAARAVSRASASWARASELGELDTKLLARSHELIESGRQLLATLNNDPNTGGSDA